MKKRIILIDDNADEVWLEELKHEIESSVNEGNSISYNVEIDYYNPTDTLSGPEPVDKALGELSSKIESDKTDLVLCDFNINQNFKLISFHFIEQARKLNSNCTIILYSGNPLKELLRLEYDDLAEEIQGHIKDNNNEVDLDSLRKFIDDAIKKRTKQESMFKIATSSNIAEFVTRPRLIERASEYIKHPSLGLLVEEKLLQFPSLVYDTGNSALDGKELGEYAKEIRRNSDLGDKFLREMLDLSTSYMIKLNE